MSTNITIGNSTNTIPIYTSTSIPNGSWTLLSGNTFDYTTNTSSTYTTTGNIKVDIKRCRTCNHAHIEGQIGCIDTQDQGWGVIFVANCLCTEYVPKDNLEFLEYIYDKKQKGSL